MLLNECYLPFGEDILKPCQEASKRFEERLRGGNVLLILHYGQKTSK